MVAFQSYRISMFIKNLCWFPRWVNGHYNIQNTFPQYMMEILEEILRITQTLKIWMKRMSFKLPFKNLWLLIPFSHTLCLFPSLPVCITKHGIYIFVRAAIYGIWNGSWEDLLAFLFNLPTLGGMAMISNFFFWIWKNGPRSKLNGAHQRGSLNLLVVTQVLL
jgi:hypothetical protein